MKTSYYENPEQRSIRQQKLVQITAKLDLRLGGPVNVVNSLNHRFHEKFSHHMIIFGEAKNTGDNIFAIKTFRNNRYGFSLRILPRELRLLISDADLLLIHGHYLFSTLISIFLSGSSKIFIMPHGSMEVYQQRKSKLKKMIFDFIFIYLCKDKNLTFILGSVSETFGVRKRFPNAEIKVVGLGIEEVPQEYEHKISTASRLQLLCISRISHKKRIDLCIYAAEFLRKRGVDVHLTIAGTGDKRIESQLKELVNNLDLSKNVDFIGFIDGDQKLLQFQNSDIFLLPSENENFAVAVAESISAKVPVVISQNVAMKDFVIEHNVGEVIHSLEISELVSAILKVKENYVGYWENCKNYRSLLYWDEKINDWYTVLTQHHEVNHEK